jgi:uncharacterized protein YecT (DUF1311 family)
LPRSQKTPEKNRNRQLAWMKNHDCSCEIEERLKTGNRKPDMVPFC